ncbi:MULTISPECIES: TrbG/VirB9 family P-type conjugative transfer protein [Pseudoxanthomonas]|uniref:Type IV secretion system protein VirB9 n=1 Tax=Pseudoxanthomonas winnipegensis TaxID=2480810 RepID=A0A4Q8M7Z9_9GAMM|nr:TrbG/VirB9 family P-type conjugative transfer protein [Pseudoxanthomonas winnipegensis]TAA45692.1 type IV secretion system protein VirB9 [Pseudoxanthomonas winnipegensis]TBV73677.1 type IV secretion system protein VirB9 [Pseudoxanthomonas winnipegensis]WJI16836.1 TrbG/VirB9 family P-type conjugative transfer protein [Pseudoxanthomonas winnipegensis]
MSAPRRAGALPVFFLLLSGLCASASVGAQVIDRYEYKPDAIYQVRTGLGITTQIELSPNEKILDYSTGFSSGWELSRRENVFYLKPKNTDVDTNMMVRTATHSYIFELKVVATDWKALDQARAAGVQYKISFVYSPDTQFATTPVAETTAPSEPPAQIDLGIDKSRRYYYDYSYATRSKAQWLIPTTVYDDGRFTYVKMNDGVSFPSGNFPSVYGRQEEHGEDFVVNTTVDKNTIVVHGTYPYLVIRHGLNVVGLRRNQQK